MEPEAGRKRWWLQQTRPCISTEMRLSHHWLLLKWRLESTTIRETGHSAKLSSFTLLRGVSCASLHRGIFSFFFVFLMNLTFFTEPKEAPSDVKAYSISSSEIRLTWKVSPGPGRPKGYEVHIKCSDMCNDMICNMCGDIQYVQWCDIHVSVQLVLHTDMYSLSFTKDA